jgi:ribulose-phosphate 3-epimerase
LSVNPGWGGQNFIESSHVKIQHLRNWIQGHNLTIPIEVDGSVSLTNLEQLIQDGAEIFVAGAAIFKQEKPQEVILKMKEIAKRYNRP